LGSAVGYFWLTGSLRSKFEQPVVALNPFSFRFQRFSFSFFGNVKCLGLTLLPCPYASLLLKTDCLL